MLKLHSVRKKNPSFAKPLRNRRFARRGDVVDTVVFMMVAILLPAFILGHLYLTFFPAPESSASEMGEVAALSAEGDSGASADASDSASGDGNSPDSESGENKPHGMGKSHMGMSHSKDPSHGGGEDAAAAEAAKAELAQLKEQFGEKANMLQTKVASLTTENQQLLDENSSLKSAAQSAEQSMGDPAEANQLREKLQLTVSQLTMAKKDSANANESLANVELMKNQLQTELTNVRTQLEQTQGELAESKRKQEELMTSAEETPLLPMAEAKPDKELMMQMEQSQAKVSQLELDIEKLRQDLKTSEVTMTARKQELQEATASVARLETRNSELETALADAKRNIAQADPAREVYRDYVSSKGSISKMAFIRWEGEDVVIVRSFTDKRLYRLALERFSEADKKYLLQQK